jgi:motility quorum-sensing regulator/GCU-specific mRNA interferase toxin
MTEKRRPHYDLVQVRAEIARLGATAFSKTALDGGRAMGLTSAEMVQVIAGLSPTNFYKAMTSYADHRVWQHVYHATTPNGLVAYIKITRRNGALVLQFKER